MKFNVRVRAEYTGSYTIEAYNITKAEKKAEDMLFEEIMNVHVDASIDLETRILEETLLCPRCSNESLTFESEENEVLDKPYCFECGETINEI
tara:strand:- start:1226 stop:1504 length:279 start_codon:yes stop_codon:yes gene_type:complete